jgi:hypothetical protein
MDVHEDMEEVREAQKRVEAKRRLEKWEALAIIGIFLVVVAFLLSRANFW